MALLVAVGMFFAVKEESFIVFTLPLVLGVLALYLISMDKVLLLISFLTPLSIELHLFDGGIGVSAPCDVLLLGVLFFFILRILHDRQYDLAIAHHPLSIAIYCLLGWMFFTSITSEYPVVSFKHLLSQLWFIVPSYFCGVLLFRDTKNIDKFVWLYMTGLVLVCCYTLFNHYLNGFDRQAAHWVMTPFYNDHTAYGAVLAMYIVLCATYLFMPIKRGFKVIVFIVLALLLISLVLSFCRASWISIVGVLCVLAVVKLRIKFKYILTIFVVCAGLFGLYSSQFIDALSKNNQDASGDILENIQSMTNISTDASNLERLNRWNSAFRMFSERPLVGWGPGTYQFVYGSFQKESEKTIISTSSGDMGNAHSEYFGPLSEMGLPGCLLMVVLVGMVIWKGLMVYQKTEQKAMKTLVLGVTLALITYFIHGILNNFLDTDKLAVPVWSCIAVITSIDLYHTK